MEFLMEMLKIVWPILLAGVISLFIILRLKSKFKGKTSDEITKEQIVGAYFMPFGMILGGIVSTIYSMFSSDSLLTNLSMGPGIGFLFGYFAYEVYSRKGESTQ